jgi:hypothetical protein
LPVVKIVLELSVALAELQGTTQYNTLRPTSRMR